MMRSDDLFRLVLLVISVIQTLISAIYLNKARVGETLLKTPQAGPLLTIPLVVSYIAFAGGVLLFLIHPPWIDWSRLAIPSWIRWGALVPLCLGAAFHVWGLHGIGANLTISPSTKTGHQLVTSGAYGLVRHPLYTGMFVESLGVSLLTANGFIAFCAAIFCLLMAIRTRVEEDNLIATFGDEYRQYMQRVGKFTPRPPVPSSAQSALSTPTLLLMVLLTYLVIGGILFGLAGRLDLPWVWMALVTLAVLHVALVRWVFQCDPELARERLRPGPGVPIWDKVILSLSGVLMLASLIAAGLDLGRLHWSDSVVSILRATGLMGVVLGMGLLTWSMAVNTFFSKAVRLQSDRGQRVIQSGPYRVVRHPGYVGWLILWISFNLTLGSWMAVGISMLMGCLVVVRTALEDRFLRNQLAGYEEYTQHVRWRLLPGVW